MTQWPREYYPDNWVIVKVKGDNPHYRVLAGWSDEHRTGDDWKLNNGIIKVEFKNGQYIFYESSGSKYICHKDTYGLCTNNSHVWHAMQHQHGDKVEMMKENNELIKYLKDWTLST